MRKLSDGKGMLTFLAAAAAAAAVSQVLSGSNSPMAGLPSQLWCPICSPPSHITYILGGGLCLLWQKIPKGCRKILFCSLHSSSTPSTLPGAVLPCHGRLLGTILMHIRSHCSELMPCLPHVSYASAQVQKQ